MKYVNLRDNNARTDVKLPSGSSSHFRVDNNPYQCLLEGGVAVDMKNGRVNYFNLVLDC